MTWRTIRTIAATAMKRGTVPTILHAEKII
jgi:hypothetical protein